MPPSLLPVIRSVLSPDALIDKIARHYDIGDNITCHLLNRGINDVYLLTSDRMKAIIRIALTNGRTPQQIRAEVEIHQLLLQNKIPVTSPMLLTAF